MNIRLIAICLLVLNYGAGVAAEYFVAPKGSDTNPGSSAKPFATLNRAQEAVRGERATHPQTGVTVTFAAGVYHLRHRLQFTPVDSGAAAEQPVRYRAAPGASVVLSGGRA